MKCLRDRPRGGKLKKYVSGYVAPSCKYQPMFAGQLSRQKIAYNRWLDGKESPHILNTLSYK